MQYFQQVDVAMPCEVFFRRRDGRCVLSRVHLVDACDLLLWLLSCLVCVMNKL